MNHIKLSGKNLLAGLVLIAFVVGSGFMIIFVLGLISLSNQNPKKTAVIAPASKQFGTDKTGIDGNMLHSCTGNKEDQCKGAPSIDFFPGGSESATNPEYKATTGDLKEIMGRVTNLGDKSLTIKTSSGRSIIIQFPIDVVTEFNTNRSSNYQNIQVGLGDALYINYSEPAFASDTTITMDRLFRSTLLLKDNNPKLSDHIEKY